MHIIDTHLHLIEPAQLSYPWTAGTTLAQRFSLEDYQAQASACGIRHALYMEVDVADNDAAKETAWAHQLNQQHQPFLAGQIAVCRPEHTHFAADLAALYTHASVKGVRRILHTSPDALSHSPLFTENLRLLPQYHYSFDLCVLAKQLRTVALPLVKQCPEVSFVLDHCGVPALQQAEAYTDWQHAISELATHPNIVCKISGLPAYAAADWQPEQLRPYVEHVIQAFGWSRVVWGSDWPVCTLGGGLAAWVAATHTLLAGCSEEEQAQLLYRNARRIYHLPNF